jgi:hypothetical protein
LYPFVRTLAANRPPAESRCRRCSLATGGHPLGPLDGFIQIGAFENVEAGQVLFGFRERAVKGDGLALIQPNRGCGGGGLEPFDGEKNALLGRLLHHHPVLSLQMLNLIRRRPLSGFLRVHQEHVAHFWLLEIRRCFRQNDEGDSSDRQCAKDYFTGSRIPPKMRGQARRARRAGAAGGALAWVRLPHEAKHRDCQILREMPFKGDTRARLTRHI